MHSEQLAAHLKAAVEAYADLIFEPLAKQISDDLNEKTIEAGADGLDKEHITSVLLPLFKQKLFWVLEEKCATASDAWAEVHFTNVMNHYNERETD